MQFKLFLPQEFLGTLLTRTKGAEVDILMAHPEANGFYKAKYGDRFFF